MPFGTWICSCIRVRLYVVEKRHLIDVSFFTFFCKVIFTCKWKIFIIKVKISLLLKVEPMGVKNIIKELRKQNHITQIEMAKAMQVTRQTIVAIENHHYNPSLELSLKIAKYFGMKVEEIFTLE